MTMLIWDIVIMAIVFIAFMSALAAVVVASARIAARHSAEVATEHAPAMVSAGRR